MTRTNIDIDDELVAEVMRRYDVSTKKQAVDLALRHLIGPKITVELLDGIRGVGWHGDIEEMRSSKADQPA